MRQFWAGGLGRDKELALQAADSGSSLQQNIWPPKHFQGSLWSTEPRLVPKHH